DPVSNSTPQWGTLPYTGNWQYSLAGDFNGDGLQDIAAFDKNTGKWWVGLSNGSAYTFSVWATWSVSGVTWQYALVGDYNGDGKADIAGFYKEGGQWWVMTSSGSTFNSATLWDTWSTSVTWQFALVGDYNSDGKADIAGYYQGGGQWW